MNIIVGIWAFSWGAALGLAMGAWCVARQHRRHRATLQAWRETLNALNAPSASLTNHDYWLHRELARQGYVMRPMHRSMFYQEGFRVEGSSPKAIAESLAVLASGGRLP